MREFVYYSKSARTAGNFNIENLVAAGRMDIACDVIFESFFVSHHIRNDARLHLIFNGAPDAPKHLEIFSKTLTFGNIGGKQVINREDIAMVIKKMLFKYKKNEKNEVFPGYFIEKKSFTDVIEELKNDKEDREIYILDRRGEDIRNIKIHKNPVFILGDQEGIPKQELKKLEKLNVKKISIGSQMYLASQTITIVNNELDRRDI